MLQSNLCISFKNVKGHYFSHKKKIFFYINDGFYILIIYFQLHILLLFRIVNEQMLSKISHSHGYICNSYVFIYMCAKNIQWVKLSNIKSSEKIFLLKHWKNDNAWNFFIFFLQYRDNANNTKNSFAVKKNYLLYTNVNDNKHKKY